MSATVFAVVLVAAVLHAGWNALVKSGEDKLVGVLAMVIGHMALALPAIALAAPVDPKALPWILASGALHSGYALVLMLAYRRGDLTRVYPIARGVAPLLVTAVSVLALGTALGRLEIAGVVAIALGLLSLGLVAPPRAEQGGAVLYALLTGGFIAAYSLVDGLGARAAGSPLGYFAWAAVANLATFLPFALWWRPDAVRRTLTRHRRRCLLTGGASFVAYALVVWAFTQAPIALVSALRETSIVAALLIGVLVLREPLSLAKVGATFATLAGAAMIRLAR